VDPPLSRKLAEKEQEVQRVSFKNTFKFHAKLEALQTTNPVVSAPKRGRNHTPTIRNLKISQQKNVFRPTQP
jgi:hypothetical protein